MNVQPRAIIGRDCGRVIVPTSICGSYGLAINASGQVTGLLGYLSVPNYSSRSHRQLVTARGSEIATDIRGG
jgi:hypothetical protein